MLRDMALNAALSAALCVACSPATPSIDAGRVLYQANGCAGCHGRSGRGDGPLAATLPSKPIDFRDVWLFKRGASETAIAKTLAQGVSIDHPIPELHSTHHQLLMPKFDHLTETERRSIARYVISMRTDIDHGRVQP